MREPQNAPQKDRNATANAPQWEWAEWEEVKYYPVGSDTAAPARRIRMEPVDPLESPSTFWLGVARGMWQVLVWVWPLGAFVGLAYGVYRLGVYLTSLPWFWYAVGGAGALLVAAGIVSSTRSSIRSAVPFDDIPGPTKATSTTITGGGPTIIVNNHIHNNSR